MTEQVPSRSVIDQADSGAPEVEFRLSRQYRKPTLKRLAIFVVLTVICVLVRNELLGLDAACAAGALAVIFGALYLWQARFATRVTGRGIEVRGYFNHFVPWDDVRDVEVTRLGGGDLALGEDDIGSQTYFRASRSSAGFVRSRVSPNRMAHLDSIKLVRASGRKLRLRAPAVTGWASDPRFSDKARQLEELCARYGRRANG